MQKEGFLAFWGFQTVSVSKTDTVLRQRKIESRTFWRVSNRVGFKNRHGFAAT
jgi:hypothetical protein